MANLAVIFIANSINSIDSSFYKSKKIKKCKWLSIESLILMKPDCQLNLPLLSFTSNFSD